MDQKRPLTPQEREWQQEKQLPADDTSDNVTLRKLPVDPASLRQTYGSNGNGNGLPPSAEQTSPALPQDIARQLRSQAQPSAWPGPPQPQFPANGAPVQGQPLDVKPTRRLEEDAMPTRRLEAEADAVTTRHLPAEPDAVTTRHLPEADAMPTRLLKDTPDALTTRRLEAEPDAMPTRRLSAEDAKWQREKQLPQNGPTPPPPALSPDELHWQREKQNYQALTPQEQEWQREKQAYTDVSSEELEWQREKQAYPAGQTLPPSLSPQEFEWQREKQNYGALTPQEREWQREKQAYAPLAPGVNGRPNNSIVPYQPTAIMPHVPAYPVKVPEKKSRRLWWLLIPLLLLILIGLVVAAFLLWPGKPADGAMLATVTPGGTPIASSGNTLDPVQATINAQARATQTAGATRDQNEQLFNQGKSAYDNRKWAEAIDAFEKIPTSSGTYTTAKPLLATAYFNQANDLALKETTAESLTQALALYDKAARLLPDNASFQTAEDNAKAYQAGQKASTNNNWETAVNQLGKAYQGNPDMRDTVQLYYTALVNRGDALSKARKYQDARDMYSKALALTFKADPPDQTELKTKMAAMDEQLKPTPTAAPPTPTAVPPTATAGPTPVPPTNTPRPQPTPTKKVAVAPPAPAPCAKGGSGSNFFAFRTGQPQVPNVADQGRSGVRGVVFSKGGAPIAGATVRISNGSYTFTSVTDGGGNYFREGLGRGIWTISVVGAPGRTMCYGAAGSANLSGQSGFYVTVDFTESVP